MNELPKWFNCFFWSVASAWSFFYAFKAFDVFKVETKDEPLSWTVHQVWFNFVGSVAGWAALYFLSRKYWLYLQSKSTGQVNIWDVAVFIIAFMGVTGHLPYALSGVLVGLKDLALKALGLAPKSK